MRFKNIVVTITLILLITPFTMFKVSAATFSFTPSSGTLGASCKQTLNIEVDATNQNSNSAEIIVSYNSGIIDVTDSDPNVPGTQVKPGNAYQNYFYNVVDEQSGVIRVAAVSYNGLSGKSVFATIEFVASAGSANFNIQFNGVGDTKDSNIADSSTSNDILTAVGNGSYTFSSGACSSDAIPPKIEFQSPTNGSVNITVDSNIIINVTDDASGIDLTTLYFIINGDIYYPSDNEVSVEGNELNYTFTIDPKTPLIEGDTNYIVVIGSDRSGKNFTGQINFNSPDGPTTTPEECKPTDIEPDDNLESVDEPLISNIVSGDNIFKGTFLENTVIGDISDKVGLSGTAFLTSTLLLLINFLPFLYLITVPGLLINFIKVFFGKKVKKPWGIVTDSTTRKIVPLATCSLYMKDTKYKVDQTVTDLDGRYGFTVSQGSYRIEIKQSGYELFVNNIEVSENGKFTMDIELLPLNALDTRSKPKFTSLRAFLNRLFISISKILFILGFVTSIISLFYSRTTGNLILFVFYILVLAFFIAYKLMRSLNRFTCAIIDSSNNLRVPFATIKVYDPNTWEVLDTISANFSGFFDINNVEEGEYAILVIARGYKFPAAKTKFEVTKDKYSSMILTNIKKGNNNLKIYVDPIN